ncbi:phosphoglycerate dehydrogenase [Ectothiorhodospiraceae bacterium 2226]|nr:phosphoglycerate dehydrogenase [Ectothiorhodospiraceae bacterium 2226]
MFKILTLNNISVQGLERLPRDRYEIASEIGHPDAVLVRSAKMHDMPVPESLKAVGRAGAGVNNIPVEKMSALGIPVFNAPGANANAVKELVIAGMLIASRNLCDAWAYTQALEGDDVELHRQVEAGKKQFAGTELPGRTLGVVGLGAIGRLVANAAIGLGMKVVGFDPGITVEGAWQLSSEVEKAVSMDELAARSDFLTVHVPLTDGTRHLINAERLKIMKPGATLLNFARDGIVDDRAAAAALDAGHLHAYVCDFPSNQLKGHARVLAFPHLGASTREAEDNCAIMVAEQVRDYLEKGNIVNSVNFPTVVLPPTEGCRVAVVNANVPNMVGQISTAVADAGLNIVDMLNKSRGGLAYTLIDVDQPLPEATRAAIAGIEGVLKVRVVY